MMGVLVKYNLENTADFSVFISIHYQIASCQYFIPARISQIRLLCLTLRLQSGMLVSPD